MMNIPYMDKSKEIMRKMCNKKMKKSIQKFLDDLKKGLTREEMIIYWEAKKDE